MKTVILRSVQKRCPNCGSGKLMASYLKTVERCSVCDEAFGHIRSDDAAPWLTILLVGHVVVSLALSWERDPLWPYWASMLIWPALSVALSLLVLPHAKALFVGVIWASRAPGSERQ